MKAKRALISVSDKTGVVEFARALTALAESYARLAVRAREVEPPMDPTEPGRQAALAYLRAEALRD